MKRVETLTSAAMIGLALVTASGCAAPKTWVSSPEIETVSNPYYQAEFEPLKRGHEFFVSFLLSITNKTDKDLEIDWNKTRYIHNGRGYSGFVFEGIDPADVRNSTIPPDIIPVRGKFSKVISPYRLLAGAPLRDQSISESTIGAGILSDGENGIVLVVRQNGKEIVENMMVTIEGKKVQ
jgi:hypothetical protein